MSHIETVEFTANMDSAAAKAAIELLGAKDLGFGKFTLYGTTVDGYGVHLPGWKFPVVITSNNEVKFDNFNGSWGDFKLLTALCTEIPVQEAIERAKAAGATVGNSWTDSDGNRCIEFIMAGTAGNTID